MKNTNNKNNKKLKNTKNHKKIVFSCTRRAQKNRVFLHPQGSEKSCFLAPAGLRKIVFSCIILKKMKNTNNKNNKKSKNTKNHKKIVFSCIFLSKKR